MNLWQLVLMCLGKKLIRIHTIWRHRLPLPLLDEAKSVKIDRFRWKLLGRHSIAQKIATTLMVTLSLLTPILTATHRTPVLLRKVPRKQILARVPRKSYLVETQASQVERMTSATHLAEKIISVITEVTT